MVGRRNLRAGRRPENPGLLTRPVDQFEKRVRLLTPLLMIGVCALALLTGVVVWNAAAASEAAQPAVAPGTVRAVTDSAAAPITSQTVGAPAVSVRAHWQWNSERRNGVIAVPAGTPAGTAKNITVDEQGDWVRPGAAFRGPISRVVPSVLLGGLVGFAGIVMVRQSTRKAVEQRHDRYWTEHLTRFFAARSD
jgi:hypothetical protein